MMTKHRMKAESPRAVTGWLMPTVVALGFLLLSAGCEKDLNIADFADEYRDYEPELRIEAILDVVEPMSSIVRVDWTILVTDTSIFNGRDDDGDWDPLIDDVGDDDGIGEGNGQSDPGEPHVDEIDEILPQIHDTTAAVELYDLTTDQLVMDFTWDSQADSFMDEADLPDELAATMDEVPLEVITYGAYKPIALYDTTHIDHDYEFRITTSEHVITGMVEPLPPPVFEINPQATIGDTLLIAAGVMGQFTWITVPEATVYWVLVEEVLAPDSLRTVESHPAAPFEQRDDGYWIGQDFIGLYLPGLYRWTVSVPSRAYGAYVYSQLPMRDEKVSNLRDEEGNVVLGIAGSAASASQYVRILGTQSLP
jgi:hypothetical protein